MPEEYNMDSIGTQNTSPPRTKTDAEDQYSKALSGDELERPPSCHLPELGPITS
jgi:hypothetical protein